MLDNEQIDLLIVDRNLSSRDSLEKIQDLREPSIQRSSYFSYSQSFAYQDLLEGFENGCDDCVCKLFDFNDLLLHIKAILKCCKKEEKLSFGDFILDLTNYEFFYKNQKLEISNLDYELVKCFFENPNTLLDDF